MRQALFRTSRVAIQRPTNNRLQVSFPDYSPKLSASKWPVHTKPKDALAVLGESLDRVYIRTQTSLLSTIDGRRTNDLPLPFPATSSRKGPRYNEFGGHQVGSNPHLSCDRDEWAHKTIAARDIHHQRWVRTLETLELPMYAKAIAARCGVSQWHLFTISSTQCPLHSCHYSTL